MAQKHILIVCGEPSGDLHAANLARAIKNINPGIKISAVGGTRLRNSGAEIYYDIKGLSVMGLFDVIKKLPKFFSLKKLILAKIKKEKSDALILVDFSGFNLRLAKAINKTVPVIYYVSPQVWASRPGRIKTIKRYIHKMIVLFKFEEEFYKKYGMDVEFAGHPLLDIARPEMGKEEFLKESGLSQTKTTVALLPGSRKSEIKNILPTMVQSACLIKNEIKDTQFLIAKSPSVDLKIYSRIIKDSGLDIKIIEGKTYDCLNASCFSLVCSGTATLEAALIQNPFCIIYKMGLLNYLLYRPQVKVPYIGMANIVAGKKIIPEFIQFNAKPEEIARQALEIIKNPSQTKQMKEELAKIKSLLGEKGASLRAAKIILDYLGA
jgi:lipid-A-disaccharide synthase